MSSENCIKSNQRSRSKNFDQSEKEVLIDLVEKHKNVINAKLTNSVTACKKLKVWDNIKTEVNAVGLCNRSTKDIRNKWSNIHQKAKKEKAELDLHRKQTGGGPPKKPMSPTSERVVQLFEDCPSFNGLQGVESIFTGLPNL